MKMRTLLIAALVAACLAGCNPLSTAMTPSQPPVPDTPLPPTPTVFIRQLTIFPDQPMQILQDVASGNFIHRYGGAHTATEPVSQMNLTMLKPKAARVALALDSWEPINDNADPLSVEANAFIDRPGSDVRATFEFMQQFYQDGGTVIASIWWVPAWLVDNPDDESQLVIPREKYPEAIESISAWLVHARDQYGVEVSFVSFNEANLGINVLLSPDDYIEFIRQAGPRFESLGLKTKWLLGDASNIAESATYAADIYAESAIRPYLGPLAFHSWDAQTSDSSLEAIASLAQANNLEVWCTEGGWDPALWQRSKEFPGWPNAAKLIGIYTRVIKLTGATTLFYWEMMGQDYSLNNGDSPYPVMQALVELKKQFPPGAQVVKTSQDGQSLKFTAARSPDGFAVIMVNQSLGEVVQLNGLPTGTYYLVRYSSKESATTHRDNRSHRCASAARAGWF